MKYSDYLQIIKSIPKPTYIPTFNLNGKLIICLIEYRIMEEIEYVINAVLQVYDSNEIGLAIVHGTNNSKYVQELFGHWKNILFINTGHDNLNRGTYSALLKMPTFWENFMNWSHILIYQTDALIIRKIDELYFEYDYIGAPWKNFNNWKKHNGGNGGFSLRNVNNMIKVCEKFRNINFEKLPKNNEDGYFCDQDLLKFIPESDLELHKAFSMETSYHPRPVGIHQLYWYANMIMNKSELESMIIYIKDNLNIK